MVLLQSYTKSNGLMLNDSGDGFVAEPKSNNDLNGHMASMTVDSDKEDDSDDDDDDVADVVVDSVEVMQTSHSTKEETSSPTKEGKGSQPNNQRPKKATKVTCYCVSCEVSHKLIFHFTPSTSPNLGHSR